MLHRNRFETALLLAALALKTSAAWSQTLPQLSAPFTNKATLNVSVRGGETVGDHQVKRAFLNIGTNTIVFVIPTDFHIESAGNDKVVLADSTSSYFVTVRVTDISLAGTDLETPFFQKRALSRFPGAKVSNQFSTFAGGHLGPAFDLAWISAAGTSQSVRIAFIPSAAGVLEFSILSRTANFEDAQRYLTVLMASVRNNETGKLVITPIPPYS